MLVAKKKEIKERRLSSRLSQRQLSTKAGLPGNALCRIEKDDFKRVIPIRAKALADALGCEISDIFEEEKNVNFLHRQCQ